MNQGLLNAVNAHLDNGAAPQPFKILPKAVDEYSRDELQLAQLLEGVYIESAKMASTHLDNTDNTGEPDVTLEGVTDMAWKYRERVQIGQDADGNAIYQTVSGNTKQELHIAIVQAIIQITPEMAAQPTISTCPLFGQFATNWYEVFKEPTIKPKTRHGYKTRLHAHIIPAFGDKRLDEVTKEDIQRFMNALAKCDISKSYAGDILCNIRQIFDAAIDDEHIRKNPARAKSVKNPCTKVEKRRALTEDEWLDVVAHIPDLKNINDRRFMALLSYTPLRPGEVYGLRWEDIDMKNCLIRVERAVAFASNDRIEGDTKTEAGVRTIPLDYDLELLLEQDRDIGFIMVKKDGTPYSPQTHTCAWKRIKKTINLYGMTPYNWRHTYCTAAIGEGVPDKTVQTLMGHKDPRMTMRYTHTQPKDIVNAGKVMENRHLRLIGWV